MAARAVHLSNRSVAIVVAAPRGCGGIGRRARFRSVWGQPRGGSSPLIRIAERRCKSPLCPGFRAPLKPAPRPAGAYRGPNFLPRRAANSGLKQHGNRSAAIGGAGGRALGGAARAGARRGRSHATGPWRPCGVSIRHRSFRKWRRARRCRRQALDRALGPSRPADQRDRSRRSRARAESLRSLTAADAPGAWKPLAARPPGAPRARPQTVRRPAAARVPSRLGSPSARGVFHAAPTSADADCVGLNFAAEWARDGAPSFRPGAPADGGDCPSGGALRSSRPSTSHEQPPTMVPEERLAASTPAATMENGSTLAERHL
jgi:hypothetical protein